MKRTSWLAGLLTFAGFLIVVPQGGVAQSPVAADFRQDIQPVFSRNCYSCHSSQAKLGGLDLEAYVNRASLDQDRPKWETILRRLKAGEMPPKGLPRPSAAEIERVSHWLEGEFDRADSLVKPGTGRVVAHRLNRAEYNNTIRDLLGVEMRPADDFPQDDSVFGFDNIAEALTVSPLLMEKYMGAAEKVAHAAVFGPELKAAPVRFDLPIPRRMETTNIVRIATPAYYSMQNYDVTGLSQPGSMHISHSLPVDGEYLFQVTGAGNRPRYSEPTEVTFWVDGKLVKTFPVDDVGLSGFERRPDSWDIRLRLPAGLHEFVAAFPKQFDGLPARYGGLNPSKIPEPPPVDPDKTFAALPVDNRPGKIEERRIARERAREQFLHPTWDGLSVMEFVITGPFDYVKGPSQASLDKIFTCGRDSASQGPECERQILSRLATRAFRRAVSTAEVDRLVNIAEGARQSSGSFNRGVEVALQAILVWPDFLFRIEKESASGTGRDSVSAYETASRLSYFLWSSMPDDELLRLAGDGTLRRPEVLKAQVKRMLADPKSNALFENFASEWLEVRRLESAQPDRDRFPDFDEYVRLSMKKETELFFENLMRQDGSILDLIDGNYTFLNERLAAHYGVPGVKGTEFRKVSLAGTGRSGIITQGSVLTVSSYATRTSPVLRGKWVLENILNAPPPPPPPNVPTLDDAAVGSSTSLRQQLEKHRANAVCASCHSRMDPLGFGLENYDAIGSPRTVDGKFPIDSSGVLPDGRTFQGADGLKSVLRQQKDAFAQGLAEKLMIYALGRNVDRRDQAAIKQIVSRMPAENYRFSSLVLGVITSDPFQMHAGETK